MAELKSAIYVDLQFEDTDSKIYFVSRVEMLNDQSLQKDTMIDWWQIEKHGSNKYKSNHYRYDVNSAELLIDYYENTTKP